ncbi:MAG: Mov34/MPN/PAD-1 family protein [Chloroflexia bacterium]
MLNRAYAQGVAGLRQCGESPTQVEALAAFLPQIAEVRVSLVRALQDSPDPRLVRDHLHRLANEILIGLQGLSWEHHIVRENLVQMLGQVNQADLQIARCLEEVERAGNVIVSSAILYQAFHTLFPPERLLVIAGRRQGKTIVLDAAFDVTGNHSGGHVRADPTLLAKALIAMDLSGTHLAAWMHSHPGNGPEAAQPSTVDRHQHQDWLRDYSPDLIGAIAVADGWVRFWGQALENGQIHLRVVGSGLLQEDKDGFLYRLAR